MIDTQPSWKPKAFESISEVAECMKTYTNRSKAFVIYSFGTTVFSDSALLHDDELFHQTLRGVVMQSPDFKVITMEDENFLIRFTGPVCGLVLADFYDTHRADIVAGVESGGLLPSEKVVTTLDIEIPKEHYFVGLYGRAKLYRDFSTQEIQIRFQP